MSQAERLEHGQVLCRGRRGMFEAMQEVRAGGSKDGQEETAPGEAF